MYRDIQSLINHLKMAGRLVWITTNGGLLYPEFVLNNLRNLTGVNISIHNYDLRKNWQITGVTLTEANLTNVISQLRWQGASLTHQGANVRLNCNCINGHIDSIETICEYIEFDKRIGAHKIRFAELKQEDDGFVDLAKILDYKYGLNDNPFIDGCNSDAVINEMPVNFRQMCGLQTSRRVTPEDPEQCLKEVLYYDGKIYNGWQTNPPKEMGMKDKAIAGILNAVAAGEMSVKHGTSLIQEKLLVEGSVPEKKRIMTGHGCCY